MGSIGELKYFITRLLEKVFSKVPWGQKWNWAGGLFVDGSGNQIPSFALKRSEHKVTEDSIKQLDSIIENLESMLPALSKKSPLKTA